METERPTCFCQSAWEKATEELTQLKNNYKPTKVEGSDVVGSLNEYTRLLKSQVAMKSSLDELEMAMKIISLCKMFPTSTHEPNSEDSIFPEHLLGSWAEDAGEMSRSYHAQTPRGHQTNSSRPPICSLWDSEEETNEIQERDFSSDNEPISTCNRAFVSGFIENDAPLIEAMFCQMARTVAHKISPDYQWAIFSYETIEGLERALRCNGTNVNGRTIRVTDDPGIIQKCVELKANNSIVQKPQCRQMRRLRPELHECPLKSPEFHQVTGWRKILLEILNF